MTWLTIACLYIALFYVLVWLCRAIWVSLSRLVWGMSLVYAKAIVELCITHCAHVGRAGSCQHTANYSALNVHNSDSVGPAMAETVVQGPHDAVWTARLGPAIHVCALMMRYNSACACRDVLLTAQGRIAIAHDVGNRHAKVRSTGDKIVLQPWLTLYYLPLQVGYVR